MMGFVGARQTTLANEVVLTGTGVHTGAPASIVLTPAEADTGIRFVLPSPCEEGIEVPADYRAVSNVTLCTVLSDGNGASVATVEHLLAAIRGLCVDNVLVEIDSGEVPIMDGSSKPFVDAIDEGGIVELDAPRRFIKILKPVRVDEGQCWGELTPYNGFRLEVEIEFDTAIIGRQRYALDVNPGAFRQELARARTFGFMSDVERLWAAGLALGASLENTIAIGEDRVINREGLRYADEFVRHKALDAIGDLALAGAPILGAFRSKRGGHRLNNLVLKALFADEEAWTMVEAPRAREVGHAEMGLGIAAANFAANST
ncbi:MAG: UDP-3-O-acyl-N-acetylglucosamine deacetylase [Hyphomicrobiales bacterium]|nr:UDP-3-O-acyl-N-acetylglucosamine deacetylase [Hyphomicrobiales bacterium]